MIPQQREKAWGPRALSRCIVALQSGVTVHPPQYIFDARGDVTRRAFFIAYGGGGQFHPLP